MVYEPSLCIFKNQGKQRSLRRKMNGAFSSQNQKLQFFSHFSDYLAQKILFLCHHWIFLHVSDACTFPAKTTKKRPFIGNFYKKLMRMTLMIAFLTKKLFFEALLSLWFHFWAVFFIFGNWFHNKNFPVETPSLKSGSIRFGRD